MDRIFYEIQQQIVYTNQLLQKFFKEISISTVLMAALVVYIIFLRKWVIRRVISFFSLLFLLLILLVRIEALLLSNFGIEGSQIAIGISRTVYLILAVVILIYNVAIKD